MSSKENSTSKCPICGAPAEKGCLYGGDGGSGLRWFPGPARASNNLWSVVGDGEPVGTIGFLTGSHAAGLHCPKCRKVILDDLAKE
jgi:hypothetical protein